jgi:Domain of unknown function (DUF4328)
MARPENRAYRDAGATAAWARGLLRLSAALSAVALLLVWRRGFGAQPAGVLEDGLLLAQLVLYVATAAVTLRWIYLANANAHALGAADMMVSPGWAVGWYFVPLMNLAMPFIAMRETWKASARPHDWQLEPAPPAIIAGWLCWLVSSIAGMIGLRLSLEFGKEGAATAEIFAFVSDLAFIPAALLLAWIVGRIQAMQSRAVPAGLFA